MGGASRAHQRGNRLPLGRQEFGEMEEFFFLRPTPIHFANARIQPFVPTCFGLLGRLAVQQRGHPRPLLFAVLLDGRLENLIFRILPNTTLQKNTDHTTVAVVYVLNDGM